jgi:hypothetical protein
MGKRLFWIFVLTMVVTTAIAVSYIQSEHFARIAKEKIQLLVARDLGIDLNFDRLRIGVLPPSVSLVNVDVKVMSRANPIGLATDTVIKAERLGFSFRMIQAFSRGVQVNKVFFNDGEVRLAVPKSKNDKPAEKISDLVHRPIHIELKDGFSISIRQLELRNTVLDLSWREEGKNNRLAIDKIGYLAVTPASAGTNLVVNLENIAFDNGKVKQQFKAVRGNFDLARNLIQLTSVDIQRREAALHASGRLTGNIDTPEAGRADFDVILRSPLTELSDFEPSLKALKGDLLADVKILGKIEDPTVRGKLEINNLQYNLWTVEKLALAGVYGNGLVAIEQFGAEEKNGRIELTEKFELPVPLKASTPTVQLKMTGARFEDFAGDLKHTVNNLRFGMDGTVSLKADLVEAAGKVKLGALNVRPALSVKNLELNNQTFGKNRPYKNIFKVQPFQLTGNVNWKGGVLSVPEAKLALASGALDVKGTVTDKGFDLTGTSANVNMGKELGSLSGIPLTGEGALALHVHGPADAVLIDFNVKQRNASFVRFNFGEVEGGVTYDDKNDLILIKNVRGKQGTATYNVSGDISIGTTDAINLQASFGESDPNDLFLIFKEQLKHLSWIPHGMSGTLAGEVTVGGGYDKALESLKINGKVRGRNLNYAGEMIHELDATASLQDGLLKAKVDEGRKYETSFTGDIEYKMSNDEMKYSLNAPRGKLRNLDFLSSTGFPIDGIFSFESSGQGKWETLTSKTRFVSENGFMRARPMPPIILTYDTHPDRSDFLFTAGSGVELSARLANGEKGASTAKAKFADANFDYLLCAISRRNCSDPALGLVINADAQFNWKGSDWRHLNGAGSLASLRLVKSGFEMTNPAPVAFTVSEGQLEAAPFRFSGDETKLGLRIRGKIDGSSLDSGIEGRASLKLLEFVSPLIEEARGRLAIGLAIGGSLADAKFNGNSNVQEGFLRLSGLDAPVDSFAGRIRFNDSRITVDSLGGQLGGGSANASGTIDLFLNRAPRFDIELLLANNRLKFVPVNYAEIADARLSFTGDKAPYLFGGTARVKKVVMRNNFDLGGQKGLQNARYLPEKVAGVKSFYEVKIRAIADGGVQVENNLLDAEFRGEVTLLGTFEVPQILARAELVRGKLLFRNTAFTLDHAYIRAPNPDYFNPQFSIGGLATVDNYRISIFASGTVDKPKITFSSSPGLPQEDIVSLLAFGYRGEDARRINPNDTSAITYSEVGSILLDQLKLNQNLQSKGIRVKVAPAFNETEERIIRRDANTQAAPKVYLQSQILRNLEASFGGTVGTTNQGQSLDAKLEYRLGRKASVSAVYEQIPTLDATKTRTSYGADLKFRWGFK